jgi:hypothetical protein
MIFFLSEWILILFQEGNRGHERKLGIFYGVFRIKVSLGLGGQFWDC